MKKNFKSKALKKLICMVLVLTMVFTCAVPAYASTYTNRSASSAVVQAKERSVTVHSGEKKLLSILYIGARWSSSDMSIVTVDNGVITGKNPGTATVKANFGILGSEEWKVTVTEANIKDKGNVTIQVNDKKLLSVLYLAADWTTSDNSIVTVNCGVITGKSEGTATVTAHSLLWGAAKWTVTVNDKTVHKNHVWNEGIVTETATCSNYGTRTYTCTICGATKTESIQKDPNNHAKIITDTKEATCTEDGCTTVKCEACGTIISKTELPATGHTWNQGTVTKKATCNEKGEIKYTCENCGAEKIKELPIDSNNHTNIDKFTIDPTCTEGGKESVICKDCGATISEKIIPAKGHTEVKEHKDPTETEDGYDRIVCSVCGEILSEEIISATGHNWDDGVITKEATCEEEGVTTYTCRYDSSHTRTEAIPKLEHNWGKGVVTKKATCGQDGVMTYTCTAGGETKTETIPATGEHTWGDPMLTNDGKINLYVCTVCGETKQEDAVTGVAIDEDDSDSSSEETGDMSMTSNEADTQNAAETTATSEKSTSGRLRTTVIILYAAVAVGGAGVVYFIYRRQKKGY